MRCFCLPNQGPPPPPAAPAIKASELIASLHRVRRARPMPHRTTYPAALRCIGVCMRALPTPAPSSGPQLRPPAQAPAFALSTHAGNSAVPPKHATEQGGGLAAAQRAAAAGPAAAARVAAGVGLPHHLNPPRMHVGAAGPAAPARVPAAPGGLETAARRRRRRRWRWRRRWACHHLRAQQPLGQRRLHPWSPLSGQPPWRPRGARPIAAGRQRADAHRPVGLTRCPAGGRCASRLQGWLLARRTGRGAGCQRELPRE
jgi:hypothetical protein